MRIINNSVLILLALWLYSCSEEEICSGVDGNCSLEIVENYQDDSYLEKRKETDSLYLLFGLGFDSVSSEIYLNDQLYKSINFDTEKQIGFAGFVSFGHENGVNSVKIKLLKCCLNIDFKPNRPIVLLNYDKESQKLLITYQYVGYGYR